MSTPDPIAKIVRLLEIVLSMGAKEQQPHVLPPAKVSPQHLTLDDAPLVWNEVGRPSGKLLAEVDSISRDAGADTLRSIVRDIWGDEPSIGPGDSERFGYDPVGLAVNRGRADEFGYDSVDLGDQSTFGIGLFNNFTRFSPAGKRRIVSHEMGHLVEDAGMRSLFGQYYDPSNLPKEDISQAYTALQDIYQKNRDKLPSKARENFSQYFAEIFANGVGVLQRIQDDPKGHQEVLSIQEKALPGTSLMVHALLKLPTYKGHVLNRK